MAHLSFRVDIPLTRLHLLLLCGLICAGSLQHADLDLHGIRGVACGAALGIARADTRATVTGKVTNSAGEAVEHATVLVYSAGVRKGYSEFCPTCWVDCGKRTTTDANGNFTIARLSPNLIFTLLVLREGYSAKYSDKVDPAKGVAQTAILKPRPPVEAVRQVGVGWWWMYRDGRCVML